MPKKGMQKRSFFKKLWAGIGLLAGVELVWLTLNFLSPKKQKKDIKNLFAAGKIKNFSRNSVTSFRNRNFFLVRLQNGGFIALSIKCSHLGCNIEWDENDEKFVCPCHSSWFTINGDVMHAPATRPLATLPIIIENGDVKINTNVILKRNSIEDTEIVYADKHGKT